MTSNQHPMRLWAMVAAAGVAVVVALSWLFLVSPQKSDRSDLLGQAADVRLQASVSRGRVAALRKDNEKLPAYKSQLSALKNALPTGAATAQFVADMQKLSNQSGVSITSINVTPPTTGLAGPARGSSGVTPLPITVAASGSTASLEHFLTLLQTTERRAVLIGQVTESAPTDATGGSAPSLTVTMKAFFTTS